MTDRREKVERLLYRREQVIRIVYQAMADQAGAMLYGLTEPDADVYADRILAALGSEPVGEPVVVAWEALFRSIEAHGESWEHEGLYRSRKAAENAGRAMVERYGMDEYTVVPLGYVRAPQQTEEE